MKKIFTFSAALFLAANTQAQLIDFESVSLSQESYDNGSALTGDFVLGAATFTNYYDTAWYSWNGFAVSNMTDTVTAGFGNQYSAYTGTGYNGSADYAVFYPTGTISVADSGGVVGFYITNTSYAAISMRDGDAYSKKFGSPNDANGTPDGTNGEDFFRVWIIGTDVSGTTSDSIEFYLADYRFANDSLDYIVDTWEYIDLSGFSFVANTISFRFESSDVGAWGINTPTYFAIDNVSLTLPDGLQELDAAVSVYPNPIINELVVKGDGSAVSIRNAEGQLVYSGAHFSESMIDVSSLPNGVYFIELQTGRGNLVRKIVK